VREERVAVIAALITERPLCAACISDKAAIASGELPGYMSRIVDLGREPRPHGSHTKHTYAAPRWQTTTVAPHVGQRIPCLYVPPWVGHGGSSFAQVAQMRQDESANGTALLLLRLLRRVQATLHDRVGDVLRGAEDALSRVHVVRRSTGRHGASRSVRADNLIQLGD
jgi:hypothetical protein